MGTTDKGIIYPDPTGVPRRQDLEDLAESADAAIPVIDWGSIGVDMGGGVTSTQAVVFEKSFAEAPSVTCDCTNSTQINAIPTAVTTDGFTIACRRIDGASDGSVRPVDWQAIGA